MNSSFNVDTDTKMEPQSHIRLHVKCDLLRGPCTHGSTLQATIIASLALFLASKFELMTYVTNFV